MRTLQVLQALGRPFFCTIMTRLALLFLILLCSGYTTAQAQSPIANRVKAMAKQLPPSAQVVAKYTDNHRHGLYYIQDNRLFFADAETSRRSEVNFATEAYSKILSCWLSPDSNFIFIVVDRGSYASFYLDDGQELWRYDVRRKSPMNVGQGFKIVRQSGSIVISKASRCLNPDAPQSRQHWMAQDHYYDLYGKIIWAKDEYRVK
jgi:hypothetical protein